MLVKKQDGDNIDHQSNLSCSSGGLLTSHSEEYVFAIEEENMSIRCRIIAIHTQSKH